jgi:hypothetical protein
VQKVPSCIQGETDLLAKTVQKLEEAMSPAEKQELFEAIDYQVTIIILKIPTLFVMQVQSSIKYRIQ